MQPARHVNILLTGASFANKGAEAMLRTVQANLIERLPSVSFYLWGESGYGREALSRGLIPLPFPYEIFESRFFRFGSHLGKWLWCVYAHVAASRIDFPNILPASRHLFFSSCLRHVQFSMGTIDAVIDLSGFAYGDAWRLNYFKRIAPLLFISGKEKCPLIFMPQAWGPFENKRVQAAALQMLNRPNVTAYARDSESRQHLQSLFEGGDVKFETYPDIAFDFSPVTNKRGQSLLATMGCERNRPIIGISPNMKVYERAKGRGTGNVYLNLLIHLAQLSIEKFNADVVLHSNEMYKKTAPPDDRYLCALIQMAVQRPDRCFTTIDHLTAEDCKNLIGQFDFLIGSRFHALVFAISQGVPCMAVGWAHKYEELFKDISQEEAVFDFRNADQELVKAAFLDFWEKRALLQKRLQDRFLSFKKRIDSLFDHVAETIEKHDS